MAFETNKMVIEINSMCSPQGYDCPTLDGLLDLCSILAGASEAAADAVASGKFDVAINWFVVY